VRAAFQYDVRCYELPGSLVADCRVNPEAPDPTGTVIWRHRISCQGEKTFSALMQQLELHRIAYDVRIVAAPAEKKKSTCLVSVKQLFVSLILVAIVSLAVIWVIQSPDAHQWAIELQQKMEGMIGSQVKHPVPQN